MGLKRPTPVPKHLFIKVIGSPYEMGQQIVRKLEGLSELYVKKVLPKINETIEDRNLQPIIYKFKDAMDEQAPELIEEMQGIADEAKVNLDDIVRINFFGGIPKPDWELGGIRASDLIYKNSLCTSFGATGISTKDNFPIVGKNWDGFPYAALRLIIWKIPDKGISHVQDCLPVGPWGEDGMNSKGLCMLGAGIRAFDGIEAFENGKSVGLPIHFLNHVIMERCENIDEAVEYLKRTPKGFTGRNQLVVHGDNIIRAENSWNRVNIVWPDISAKYPSNYVMAATNHFSSKKMNDLSWNRTEKGYIASYCRYERAKEILVKNAGQIDFALIKKIARDHVNGPGANSICRHGKTFTNGSMILQPAFKRVWILMGNPCMNEWTSYTMDI